MLRLNFEDLLVPKLETRFLKLLIRFLEFLNFSSCLFGNVRLFQADNTIHFYPMKNVDEATLLSIIHSNVQE